MSYFSLKGFSLIEVLISLSISGLLAGTMLKIYSQTAKYNIGIFELVETNRQILRINRFFHELSLQANYGYFRPLSEYNLRSYGVFRFGLYGEKSESFNQRKAESEVLSIAFVSEVKLLAESNFDIYSKRDSVLIFDMQKAEYFAIRGKKLPLIYSYKDRTTRIAKQNEKSVFLSYPERKSKYPSLFLIENHRPKVEILAKIKKLNFRYGENGKDLLNLEQVTNWDKIRYLEVYLELPKYILRRVFYLPNK